MRAASYQPSSYQYQASFGSRATSVLLTLLVIALMLLMLLRMGILPPLVRETVQPTMLKLLPPRRSGASPSRSSAKEKHAARSGSRAVPVKVAPAKAPKPPVVPPPPVPWNVIPMTHDQFAASDISKIPSHPAPTKDAGDAGDGSGNGHSSGSTYGPGEGPGGEQLFNAEWYRRPTDAEMAFYMPKDRSAASGWGDVACRTVAHYHVEDCVELGESPGSGFARAVKQAAWQFLVKPPRINGTSQVGAWVRIHYVFTLREAGDQGSSGQ